MSLSAKDKFFLWSFFNINQESATIALRKFQMQKNMRVGKGSLLVIGFIKLVQRFEENGTLENLVISERPCLIKACLPRVASEMETFVSDSAVGTSNAHDLPDTWTSTILNTHFMQYLICTHTDFSHTMNFYQKISYRGKHLWSGLSPKPNKIPLGYLAFSGEIKVVLRFKAMWIPKTVAFGRRIIHRECTQKSLHPPKVKVCCGFTGLFIIEHFFFEMMKSGIGCNEIGCKACWSEKALFDFHALRNSGPRVHLIIFKKCIQILFFASVKKKSKFCFV